MTDPSIREIVDSALAASGVKTLVPTGQVFDPRRQRAVGSEPTDDAGKDNLIAGTDSPGYEDHGNVIRKPEVVVFRREVTR